MRPTLAYRVWSDEILDRDPPTIKNSCMKCGHFNIVGCSLTFLCGMELLNLLYSSEPVIGSGPLRLISAKRSDLSKPPQNHS